MLIFIGPRRQTDRIRAARKLGVMPRMVTRTYSWLYRTRRLPAATYVFLTIDRLDMFEKRLAGKFYRYINSLGPGWRALNNPQLGIGRFPLLKRLKEAGINDFEGYLALDRPKPKRFPVFVRRHCTLEAACRCLGRERRQTLALDLEEALCEAPEPCAKGQRPGREDGAAVPDPHAAVERGAGRNVAASREPCAPPASCGGE